MNEAGKLLSALINNRRKFAATLDKMQPNNNNEEFFKNFQVCSYP